MKKLIYIAGPYIAETAWGVEMNIRRAEKAWFEVNSWGYAGICIHSMGRFFQNTLTIDHWQMADLEMLARCDAMFVCEGWEQSAGTLKEITYCGDNEIPVFYDLNYLKTFLDEGDIDAYL